MNFKRMWAVLVSRNYEFLRDRAAFGWNFLFPFLIVAGFALVFGNDNRAQFKVGVFPVAPETAVESLELPDRFKETLYLDLIYFDSFDQALDRLSHHKIDILIKNSPRPWQYWISDTSPKGYVAEKIFRESTVPLEVFDELLRKEAITTVQIRYIDWLFPGILGMNMMFSALYGVGFVIVRYRKNGVLKRLKATPVTALEYLTAQMLSRVFLIMFTIVIVWFGCDLTFDFHTQGSVFDAAVVFTMGAIALSSMGLLIASRGTSEEFANGVINFISWPMMFLSEVWFSLEGAPGWIKTIAGFLPLTRMLSAIRDILNDGATLAQVGPDLMFLGVVSLACILAASWLFSWTK
ncbi:MAG: ABC transporter permease [Desulfobacterium sp.]|nr:ABC transporter permease [Desulfobacterium sp.]